MQVIESVNDGLKRELKIVVAAEELEQKLTERLNELRAQARINGFRPGKVPIAHLRQLYGRSVLAEVIQSTVNDTSQKAIEEREEKPAYQPEIKLPEDEAEVEKVLDGKADLAFSMAFEVVPDFEIADFSSIKLEKLKSEVNDEQVDEALATLAKQYRDFTPRGEGEKAQEGDRVIIDFVGRVDGEAFEGGSQEGAPLELGSNSFIPGFEEQLIGAKAGEAREVKVAFPEDYAVDALAGKEAVFEVTVKEVAEPREVTIDDEFATRLGFENLEKLRDAARNQLASEYEQVSRAKLKRQLLDKLDEAYDFPLPERLVEQEFEQIWHQVTHELEHSGKSFEDEGTTEDKAREEYRGIAERRVRLGLVLGRVGEKNEITVGEDEVNRALIDRVRQFPGQERQVYEFYRNNPQALLELRGPIFEDKVIDFITELASVEERSVSREELYRDPDEDAAEQEAAPAKQKPKKAPAKKKAPQKTGD